MLEWRIKIFSAQMQLFELFVTNPNYKFEREVTIVIINTLIMTLRIFSVRLWKRQTVIIIRNLDIRIHTHTPVSDKLCHTYITLFDQS